MKHIRVILSFFLLVSSVLSAQDDLDFPSLDTKDIPGGNILQTSYFDGNALWGHIDGGADIYLEYGFDKLLFQEIQWKDVSFRVEYYRMKDAEAAFGIYSVSRFKCAKSDTLSNYVCINPYQVQSALGRFYISIANDKGSSSAEKLTIELFQFILNKNKEKIFELPELFSKHEFAKFSAPVKFINGKLGLQNGFPNWEELFGDLAQFEIYILPIEEGDNYFYVSKITFKSESDLKNFSAKVGLTGGTGKTGNQKTTGAKTIGKISMGTNTIIYYETNNKKYLSALE